MADPIRVYALADELGMGAPSLVGWLAGHGVFGKNSGSWIDGDTAEWVRDMFRRGEGAGSLSVSDLAKALRVSEPLAMAMAREHIPDLVGSNQYLDRATVAKLRDAFEQGTGRQRSDPSFAVAPPTWEALAGVLGVPRALLQDRYAGVAGPGTPLSRGAVFSLVDEFHASATRGSVSVSTRLLARTLMVSEEQVAELMAGTDIRAERGSLARASVPAVLAAWLRLVRRSGLANVPEKSPGGVKKNESPTRIASAVAAPSAHEAAGSNPLPGAAPRLKSPMLRCTPLLPEDPSMLGDYELLDRLGQGGMGTVYRARRLGTASDVALKALAEQLRGNAEALERFRREAGVLKEVGGAFTAKVIDVDSGPSGPFLVMELLDGSSLEHVVDTTGPMPDELAEAIAFGLADALVAMHNINVIHRDLKPANVMLTTAGPKVIDFGVAQLLELPPLTDAGFQPGTLPYMAPEQFLGHVLGSATDVFAWAGTVLFSLTANDPFPGVSRGAIMRAVLDDDPRDLPLVQNSMLLPLLERSFSKDAGERPAAQDIREGLLRGRSLSAARHDAAQTVRDLVSG